MRASVTTELSCCQEELAAGAALAHIGSGDELTGAHLVCRTVYSVAVCWFLRVVSLVLRCHQHTITETSNLEMQENCCTLGEIHV